MHLEAVPQARQKSEVEGMAEVVVRHEQKGCHLDEKNEGGGKRAGSAGMAICHWPPDTQTLGGTTQERRNRM